MESVKRVVVTGMGVVAPNGIGIENFSTALKNGESGIEFIPELKELGLGCHVGGIPKLTEDMKNKYLPSYLINRIETSCLDYGIIAGLEAWKHANLLINEEVVKAPLT